MLCDNGRSLVPVKHSFLHCARSLSFVSLANFDRECLTRLGSKHKTSSNIVSRNVFENGSLICTRVDISGRIIGFSPKGPYRCHLIFSQKTDLIRTQSFFPITDYGFKQLFCWSFIQSKCFISQYLFFFPWAKVKQRMFTNVICNGTK